MDSLDFEVITSDSDALAAAHSASQSEKSSSAGFGWIQPEDLARDFVKLHDGNPYSQLRLKFWGNQVALPTGTPSSSSLTADHGGSASIPTPAEAALDDEDDIHTGCGIIDIDIPSFVEKLFVRADYMRVYDRLEQRRSELTGKGVLKNVPAVGIVTGHPGVGKSVWMAYAMLRRLAERKVTVVFLGTYCVILAEDAVYRFSNFAYLQCLQSDVWVLADSQYAPDELPTALVRPNHVVFTVYAAFPDKKSWSWVNDISSVVIAVMNPWTFKELHFLALAKGLDLDRVDDALAFLGPLPRLCIDYLLQRPTHRERYQKSIESDIQKAPLYGECVQWALSTPSGSIEVPRYKLALAVTCRAEREDVESAIVLRIATPYIAQRLLSEKCVPLGSNEASAIKFYATLPGLATGFNIIALRSFVPWGDHRDFYLKCYYTSGSSATYANDGTGRRLIRLDGNSGYYNYHVNIPSEHNPASLPTTWFYLKPESIVDNTVYIQAARPNRLFDSFFLNNRYLYIFRATNAAEESISTELLAFFEDWDRIPKHRRWSIVFLVPNHHSLLYVIPDDERLKAVCPCTIETGV